MEKLIFKLLYMFNKTPWDVEEMPIEIVETVNSGEFAATNALDIGCGTGDYSFYLAQQGWQVIGIDFTRGAIDKARKKGDSQQLDIDFRVGDISQLDTMHLPATRLVLDIKCSHSLSPEKRSRYIDKLWAIMEADSLLLLEALHPRSEMGFSFGLSEADVRETYGQRFTLAHSSQNDFSGWYWLRKS